MGRKSKMIKKILKVALKVLLVTFKVFLIVFVILNIFNLHMKIALSEKRINRKISQLVSMNNETFDNMIEILATVQELEKNTNDNISKIKDIIPIIPDTEKLLKGSVVVSGLEGMGSGTIIKKTKDSMYLLTCAHVIDDVIWINEQGINEKAKVMYSKSDENNIVRGIIVYEAEIKKYDTDNDLALLQIKVLDDNLEELPVAENEPIKGDTVYSIGNPLGYERTISKGILSNKDEDFYMSDNTSTFGNSGGGLFNIKGELIGIPSNVDGYKVGLDFVPESSLALSISLPRIKAFLEGVKY